MNTPGFTAEASLGRSEDGYTLDAHRAETTGAVVPQIYCQCRWTPEGFVCICFPVHE
jgi:hypothetical protein